MVSALPRVQYPLVNGPAAGSVLLVISALLCCFSLVHVAMSVPLSELHLASRLDNGVSETV